MKALKNLGMILLAGFLLFSAFMIMSRLKMVELAYEFETLKNDERSLHEEQVKLKAALSERLSPVRLRAQGFQEPKPEQVIAIP